MRISDWSSDVCSSDLEDGVHYHARDVAVMRGLLEKCPVVLASATPAIETRQQVEIGRYREIKLPSRYGGAELPEIAAIDLTRAPPERGRWIRSEEHTSELQSLMRISYAVFCLKKNKQNPTN